MPHAPRTKTRAQAEGEAAAEDGGVVPVAAQALAGQGVVLEQERPEVSRGMQRLRNRLRLTALMPYQ
jgi:hypothetical protein